MIENISEISFHENLPDIFGALRAFNRANPETYRLPISEINDDNIRKNLQKVFLEKGIDPDTIVLRLDTTKIEVGETLVTTLTYQYVDGRS